VIREPFRFLQPLPGIDSSLVLVACREGTPA